jgi:hypothetical protein
MYQIRNYEFRKIWELDVTQLSKARGVGGFFWRGDSVNVVIYSDSLSFEY